MLSDIFPTGWHAVEMSGLTVDEIRGRSFVAILKNRGRV